MASFDTINYSLRPSKTIQRHLVFNGVHHLQGHLDFDHLVYIGLGSIWFTDFAMAHKVLGIDDMISIEAQEIGYRRATFNAPYATVRVIEGLSGVVLPKLFVDPAISRRPWMVWLDYDGEFDESVSDDVRSLVENAPENSILLITFNGHEMSYGRAPERVERLRDLFGDVVPDDLPKNACKDERMQQTLADLALDFTQSVAADLSRPGGFVPAFRIVYKDSAPMVTVGGLLPSKGAAKVARDLVADQRWRCKPTKPIIAPHLTIREAASLQAMLPRAGKLTRVIVQGLGFDLEDDQVEAFQNYYRQYPAFAQILA
ncbi:O-methyltransferase [Mesorhizobium sp. M0015]|uniref:O-methyltransferase n=1 Tax=Mesorhizobium sp. M0015 TaxID=2956842 RepID=UPI00333A125D